MANKNGYQFGQVQKSSNIFGASVGQTAGSTKTTVFNATTGTGGRKYEILICTEDRMELDEPLSTDVKMHSITAIKEYTQKSTEELRWEDYQSGRKGPQTTGNGYVLTKTSSDVSMKDVSAENPTFGGFANFWGIGGFGYSGTATPQRSVFGTFEEPIKSILKPSTVAQPYQAYSWPTATQTGFAALNTTPNWFNSTQTRSTPCFVGGMQTTTNFPNVGSYYGVGVSINPFGCGLNSGTHTQGWSTTNGLGLGLAIPPAPPLIVADAATQVTVPITSETKPSSCTNQFRLFGRDTPNREQIEANSPRSALQMLLYDDFKQIEVADNEFTLKRSPKRLVLKPLAKVPTQTTMEAPAEPSWLQQSILEYHRKRKQAEQTIEPGLSTGVVLQRSDYYTIPSLNDLSFYLKADGSCVVPNFTVGRKGYGSLYFGQAIDVAGLNLDKIVYFRKRQLIMYPNYSKKPAIGQGLNRKCQVTIDGIWPREEDGETYIRNPQRLADIKFEDKLRRINDESDERFVEYRPETGSWVYLVKHF